MRQDQQSPHFLKCKEQIFTQNSFNQYLPKEQSFQYSQQNYLMMLNYCTSLEKQVQGLKEKLRQQTESNKELTKYQRQTNNLYNTNNNNLLNSFHLVNRMQQRKNSMNNFPLQKDDLSLQFQREMIVMLKQENLVLTQKIKKLYEQNQRLLSFKIGRKDEKQVQSIDISLPFNKINLSSSNQNQSKAMKPKGTNIKQRTHLPPQELNQKLHLLHKKLINSNESLFNGCF